MRKAELHTLLRTLLESGDDITDLNFTAGKPPQVERNGELSFPFVDPPLPELTPFMTELLALNLIGNRPGILKNLVRTGSCDFAYSLPGRARFRINVFSQRGCFTIILRRLATKIPTIHDLFLPRIFSEFTELRAGLVLITGGPGTGKTTTLSSLVHEFNMHKPVHIVTLEDPVEFLHGHQVGTVNQREFGTDFSSWSGGVRAAMRQGPRVIVVGELSDRETVEAVLCAAETGHLVFSTMRTVGAGQTVDRIVSLFDPVERPRIRQRLAECLRYCVAQVLVPRVEAGRIAALEIMVGNYRVQDLIRLGEREEKTFYRLMTEGKQAGMQTADEHLLQFFGDGLITEETCRAYTSNRPEIAHRIDRIQGAADAPEAPEIEPVAGEPDEVGELKMDFTFGRERHER